MPRLLQGNVPESHRKLRPGALRNRQTLIRATLDCIAEIGVTRTSVSEITARAGLSRGMIHLHFAGKENLLVAAAETASIGYFENLDRFLDAAGGRPQQRIEALVLCDMDARVLNRRTVAIWHELRGEARETPSIASYSDTRDDRLRSLAFRAFDQIARDDNLPGAAILARDLTHGTLALLEGMWTDFFLHPDSFSRETARRIIFRFLAAQLPDRFDLKGARR